MVFLSFSSNSDAIMSLSAEITNTGLQLFRRDSHCFLGQSYSLWLYDNPPYRIWQDMQYATIRITAKLSYRDDGFATG